MEKQLIEITAMIFVEMYKKFPGSDIDDLVKTAEKAARLIVKITYEDTLKAHLHNLKMDYDALHGKWKDLVLEAQRVREEMHDK